MKTFKHITYISAVVIATTALSACYEDKGNYVYDESIHDISVSMPSSFVVKLQKNKFTYQITPDVKTFDGNDAQLQYVWLLNNEKMGSFDTIATTKTLDFEIDPQSKDFAYEYKFRLYVTDPATQGVTMVPTALQLAKPYSYSWLVLHETDGHAELGSVDYSNGHILVTPDAYTMEQGKSFTGKPLSLVVAKNYISSNTYWGFPSKMVSEIYVTTDNPDESGLLDQVQYLNVIVPWQHLVMPEQQPDLDYANMQTATGNAGMIVASKGNVFRNCNYSPCIFKLNPSTQLEGDYYIDQIVSGPNCGLGYDSKGHRFVLLEYTGNWYSVPQTSVKSGGEISPIRNPEGSAANPNAIPSDEQIIRLINGYRYSLENPAAWLKYSAYAYSLCPNNKSKVYVFHYWPLISAATVAGAPLAGVYQFATPQGVTASTPMCSSFEYNNIIFYAVGPTIFKLDFVTGKSTVVYTCEDPAAQITQLHMAVESYTENDTKFNNYAAYGHPYSQCLGAAVQTADGKGQLIVLQLNGAGNVDADHTYPSVQIHKGFGKIKDFSLI